MSLNKMILQYAEYNHWANVLMTQWLKSLQRPLLYQETSSSFGSIDLTVQHMNRAQNFWFTVITEGDVSQLDETIKINSADLTMSNLLAGSQQMFDLMKSFTEEALLKPVSSPAMEQCRYEYLLHMVNHNSYHRGQVVTMSRCLGIERDIPCMDYEVFLWAMKNPGPRDVFS